LTFDDYKKRNANLQRKEMEIAKFFPIAGEQFCLLSYWLMGVIEAFSSGFPTPFKNWS
jgi:hypothetical protein